MLRRAMLLAVLLGLLGLGALLLPACGGNGGGTADDTIVRPMGDYQDEAAGSIDETNAAEELDRLEREIEAEGD